MERRGRRNRDYVLFVWLSAATAGVGCGSGSSPSYAPSPGPAAVITLTSAGANPQRLTVKPGTQVTFVNNDSIVHQMYSDPHPEHTDCPELDAVGYLAPGQSRQTANLNTPRTCGFHDHLHFENASLRGAIVIQP
jgi:plastocyanin